MAGIKVTDLPVLGAAASDDALYIVDTSTNTSKQIAVEDIIPTITSTDGSITIDNTDPSAPDLSANQITSLNLEGDTFAEFRSENGVDLYAKFNNSDFNNPFTIANDEGIIKISFFDNNKSSTQAAAIADATDSNDVITKLYLLLAAMRAYGLIAE
jgi:hypothetical protein